MQENETDGWWNDAEEVLAPGLPLASLGNELLSFVPPPPRPSLFMLEELGSEAFTATCDLCDWAWRDQVAGNRTLLLPVLPTAALGGELGWVLTLTAVALLSAVIGAAVMVTVMHCRKLKAGNSGCCTPGAEEDHCGSSPTSPSPELHPPTDDTSKTPPLPESRRPSRRGRGFWSNWLWDRRARRSSLGRCRETASSLQRRAPRRLCPPAPPASENHYTVTDPVSPSPAPTATATPAVEEALYAELHERASSAGGYQNTSYLQVTVSEPDLPSAPSSAYYSDLSCGGGAVYEAVQGEEGTPPRWNDLHDLYRQQQPYNDLVLSTVACRIATITKTVPSDYV